MVIAGGDDLDENFVIGDSSESSDSEDLAIASATDESSQDAGEEEESDLQIESDTEPTAAKKSKLNWRESAVSSTGSGNSQAEIVRTALVAAAKYFPTYQASFSADDIGRLNFLDASELIGKADRSLRETFSFLGSRVEALSTQSSKNGSGLRVIVVTSSTPRALYLIKELREYNKAASVLPLFFHGGGRKKEQAKTQETVLAKGNATIAVCLPSRLRAVCKDGIVSLKNVDLVLFDLKANERGLNVLSQKDTMQDCLDFIGNDIVSGDSENLSVVLI